MTTNPQAIDQVGKDYLDLTHPIDWATFCSHPSNKPTDVPFILNGWKYATNGYIAIRRPSTQPPSQTPTLPWPPIESVFAWPEDLAFLPTPGIVGDPKLIECPHCNGHRRQPVQCCTCKGTGSCTCSRCQGEHDCGKCRGNGEVYTGAPCNRCRASGKVLTVPDQRWAGCTIDGTLYMLMESLPRLTIAARAWTMKDTTRPFLCFRFAGDGQGVLAAMGWIEGAKP